MVAARRAHAGALITALARPGLRHRRNIIILYAAYISQRFRVGFVDDNID